jgi:hypothetical protein
LTQEADRNTMADTTTGAEPAQAAGTAQPQAGTVSPPQAGGAQSAPAAGAAAESGTGDVTRLTSENADLRKENASFRTRLKALEAAEEARQTASLSDIEKRDRRIAELERENADFVTRTQESTVRMAVLDAASRLGFRSPELAFRALDRTGIEFKDDGTPKNVEKLLRELLEREPYLGKPAGAPDFGGGPRGQTPTGGPDMNSLLRAAAKGG